MLDRQRAALCRGVTSMKTSYLFFVGEIVFSENYKSTQNKLQVIAELAVSSGKKEDNYRAWSVTWFVIWMLDRQRAVLCRGVTSMKTSYLFFVAEIIISENYKSTQYKLQVITKLAGNSGKKEDNYRARISKYFGK
ncbi:hypothetical protein CDAR_203111 [Caerostris darwini]|uniref:LAGLIDADG homing endonuclease n=1 Tax=Caerostris darwini TaxID=1538125 RepID=A0AAV4QB08_9ARAC|nr:hypothetical protein CDAR_203111 [Caerostris darwini]